MASEAGSYREDVEQLQRRFIEFRETHAARSGPPELKRAEPAFQDEAGNSGGVGSVWI